MDDGLDGVEKELAGHGYPKEAVEKYLQLFKEITNDIEEYATAKRN